MFPRHVFRTSYTRQCTQLQLLLSVERGSQSTSARKFTSHSLRNVRAEALRSQPNRRKPVSDTPVEDRLKFAGRRPHGFGKLERKVSELGEVVLFKAPSQKAYILTAYVTGAACFAYVLYHSYNTFRDPKIPLATWVKLTYGGLCIIMSAMGTVFIFRTRNLIKAVTAVKKDGNTVIQFAVRRMVPFQKPWEFHALPRQVAFSRRLVVHANSLASGGELSAFKQNSAPNFFKSPFKSLSFQFWRGFTAVRQLFTQEDFILLDVEGQKSSFRMDSKGMVSNDLLLLGNPVDVRYSS